MSLFANRWAVKAEHDEDTRLVSVPTEQSQMATPKVPLGFSYFQKMKNFKDPETWEEFTQQVLPILDEVEAVCKSIVSSQKLQSQLKIAASHWLQMICDIRGRANRIDQTVIGVLGNTGDGKSSTINALLDEESLLPTNCMRACTAVVTEVSYNNDTDEENPYRAEVEFISRDTWVREVDNLLKDFVTDGSIDMEHMDPKSDAAKSLAKIQAVYSELEVEVLADSTSLQLVEHPNVRQVLGTTKVMKAPTAQDLRDQIEPYVDSKNKDDDTAAYWPLVKVVRIFTKAKVLANGVTIVDLPGHQDWDAARAAIASEYMKSCSGIWIVAPINRAVDNKTAKDLMSDSIKQQLKLDGAFSTLTVICSKTDDISLNSAMESLKGKLDCDTMKAWKDAQGYERRIRSLEKELIILRRRHHTSREPSNECAKERLAKRARTEPPKKLSETMASQDSAELQNTTDGTLTQLEQKSQELADLKLGKKQLLNEIHSKCIHKRNNLSREAVKQHLAKGFKELDRKEAMNRPGPIHAEREVHDYDEISQQTPVFCTSSQVYMKMRGFVMSEDDSTPGYISEEDTEIPQLQIHAQNLTENLRIGKHKEVLSGICQVLNSIVIWAQNEKGSSASIDIETLKTMFTVFEAKFSADVEDYIDKLHNTMQIKVYDELGRLVSLANAQAEGIALDWTSGRIHWGTLKATFRRNGVFKEFNMNEELLMPIKRNITEIWGKFFQLEVPVIMDLFSVAATQRLTSFHEDIVKKLGDHDYEQLQASEQLERQLKLHRDKIMQSAAQNRADIEQAQKDASRAFMPAIVNSMTPGYQECAAIKGKRSITRSRGIIELHLLNHKSKMFRDATANVKRILKEGLKLIEENTTSQIKTVSATMQNDYIMALSESHKTASRVETSFKTSMIEVLERAEAHFK